MKAKKNKSKFSNDQTIRMERAMKEAHKMTKAQIKPTKVLIRKGYQEQFKKNMVISMKFFEAKKSKKR